MESYVSFYVSILYRKLTKAAIPVRDCLEMSRILETRGAGEEGENDQDTKSQALAVFLILEEELFIY